MKNIISFLALPVLMGTLSLQAQDAQKIGTVNLQKVYTEYWKTKKADEALKRKVLEKKKIEEDIEKDLKDLDGQIQKIGKQLQDPTLSAAERNQRAKHQQKLINEARETAQTLQQYRRATQAELQKEQTDTIQKLMDEVREVVGTIAKAKGFTFVIDSSAKAGPGLVLIYSDGKNEITSEVAAQLEATNPEKTSTTQPAPKKK